MNLREFCSETVALLNTSGTNFGQIYIQRTMELYRLFKYNNPKQKFGLFSSVHGPDFFSTIIECLDGRQWKTTTADNRVMEFEKNFSDFIKFYRNEG